MAYGSSVSQKIKLDATCIPWMSVWVTDNEGLPMKKGWIIATNMEELSRLSKYICDDSHTHGQTRGKAPKLAENYTFSLTDFIHNCFRSRASPRKNCLVRERLAVPAMSTTSKMYGRALASAGLTAVPQQPNMSETWAGETTPPSTRARRASSSRGAGAERSRTVMLHGPWLHGMP